MEDSVERSIVARLKNARHLIAVGISLLLFTAALWVLHRELTGIHLSDVLARLASVEVAALGFALAFTAASYLALTGYDALALRHVGCSLPYSRVAQISFIATAVGHNLGVAMLSGGAVRLRMYTASGLSATEVAAVVAMVGLTFGTGVAFVAAAVLALEPAESALLLNTPKALATGVGLAVLLTLGVYLILGALRRRPVQLGPWQLRIPGPATTAGQIALATADLACAAAALYVLLPADVSVSYPLFLSVYVLAIVAGIASHVPAGIGVFETVLDLGLSPLKIGEEAVVDLGGFSLAGSARADLRQAQRKVARLGVDFELVEVGALDDPLMAELAAVSDAWLGAKSTREKGFSVGRFDPAYLRHFPCALARKEGRILAFANLWSGDGQAELSIDLMRHVPGAPNGMMDYLFVELMLWAAARGYRRFNLGMAPLSGLETGQLAPLWHRLGTLMFRHGEHFYNFEGLRAYKEKFRPEWHPKYLALPPGISLPASLLDIASAISGSVRGIVAR